MFRKSFTIKSADLTFTCDFNINVLWSLNLQVSVSIDKKILMLFNLNDPQNPVELAFEHHYGNIASYRWYSSLSHILIRD